MKLRTMIFAMAMLVASASFAQIDLEGRQYGSVNFGLSGRTTSTNAGDSTVNGPSAMTYNFALCYFYMLNSNIGLGAEVGYAGNTSKSTSFGTTSTTGQKQFFFAPTLYYFNYCYGDFGLTAAASLHAGIGNNFVKSVTGNDEFKRSDPLTEFGFNARVGGFYTCQNFLFYAYMGTLSLQYSAVKLEGDGTPNDPDYTNSSFDYALFGQTKQFLIGMSWNLPWARPAATE